MEKIIQPNIILCKDSKEKKFLIKRYLNYFQYKEESIREILTYKIGKNIVNINQVYQNPKNITLDKIDFSDETITLHNYIEGIHDPNICMKLGIFNQKSFKMLVEQDKSLCKIAAFNAFINNRDCHFENLIKNEKTNEFTIIDFGRTFNYFELYGHNNTTLCYDFFKSLNGQDLSAKELNTITIFSETLSKLVKTYPPKIIMNKWMKIAQEIDCIYDEDAKTYLKNSLDDNFNNNIHLLNVLENLLWQNKSFFQKINYYKNTINFNELTWIY